MTNSHSEKRIDRGEVTFTFARSSGSGGQNVNKVNSKAILRWRVQDSQSISQDVKNRFIEKYKNKITLEGDFLLSCEKSRDQNKNVSQCLQKLNDLVVSVALPPKSRVKTRPSRSGVKKRLQKKKLNSERKSQRHRVSHDD